MCSFQPQACTENARAWSLSIPIYPNSQAEVQRFVITYEPIERGSFPPRQTQANLASDSPRSEASRNSRPSRGIRCRPHESETFLILALPCLLEHRLHTLYTQSRLKFRPGNHSTFQNCPPKMCEKSNTECSPIVAVTPVMVEIQNQRRISYGVTGFKVLTPMSNLLSICFENRHTHRLLFDVY